MSFKEWNAVVGIGTGLAISAWVLFEMLANPASGVAEVAARLAWAILYSVVINIVAIIVTTILISVARREEFKDERADERDRLVAAKSMSLAYVLASVAGLGMILLLAFGFDPAVATYAFFFGLMLAGIAENAARLYFYRVN